MRGDLASSLLLLAGLGGCAAAPAYAPFTPFSNFSLRTDLCPDAARLSRGEVSLRDVLAGKTLVVAAPDPRVKPWASKPGFLQVDEHGDLSKGVLKEVLDQVSQRAGFFYKNSYTFLPAMPEFPRKNWDEYLQWSVGAYDIVIEWFLQTPGRQDLGISFIKGWYDASLVLIAIDQSSGDGSSTAKDLFYRITLFAKPFEWQLWAALGGVLLFSNLIFWLVKSADDQLPPEHKGHLLVRTVFGLSNAANVVSHFRPRTLGASLFAWAFTVFVLLVAFAYVANMVSLLLVKHTSDAASMLTLDDMMDRKLAVCVASGTTSSYNQANFADLITARFPRLTVRTLDSTEDVIREVLAGVLCTGAVMPRAEWQEIEKQRQFNPGCEAGTETPRLRMSGEALLDLHGGFVVKTDAGGAGSRCSSLLQQALDLHVTEMVQDGSLANIWGKYLASKHDAGFVCPPLEGSRHAGLERAAFSLEDMAGLFILFAGVCLVAVAVSGLSALMSWFCPPSAPDVERDATSSSGGEEDGTEEFADGKGGDMAVALHGEGERTLMVTSKETREARKLNEDIKAALTRLEDITASLSPLRPASQAEKSSAVHVNEANGAIATGSTNTAPADASPASLPPWDALSSFGQMNAALGFSETKNSTFGR